MSKPGEVDIPPIFKPVTPYIRRAEELDRSTANLDAPALSYFCRSYAMGKCLKLKGSSSGPEISTFLSGLMNRLESDRASIQGTDKDSGKPLCENFAFSLFTRADDEDRSGNITKNTAKAFYSASNMFDVLEQFGNLDSEAEQKRKYAKWKAAEIIKALKEGRVPTAGGFNEGKEDDSFADLSEERSTGPSAAHVAPLPPATPIIAAPPPYSPLSYTPSVQPQYQPPVQPLHQPTPSTTFSYIPPKTYSSSPSSANDPRVKDAIEFAEFAIAAMKRNDVSLAKDRLQEALRRLG